MTTSEAPPTLPGEVWRCTFRADTIVCALVGEAWRVWVLGAWDEQPSTNGGREVHLSRCAAWNAYVRYLRSIISTGQKV